MITVCPPPRHVTKSRIVMYCPQQSCTHLENVTMSYHHALSFANGLINTNKKLKSCREVIDWLKSVISSTYIFNWKKKSTGGIVTVDILLLCSLKDIEILSPLAATVVVSFPLVSFILA